MVRGQSVFGGRSSLGSSSEDDDRRFRIRAVAVASLFLASSLLFSQDVEQQIRDLYQKAEQATHARRYADAENEYQAVLKLNPSIAEAHANLGIVYYLDFKYELAAESFEKALRILPTLTRARLYLGLAEFYLGRYQKSVHSLQRALAGNLEAPYRKLGRTSLARDYLALDETENAIAVLKPLSDDFPADTDALYMLGKAYLRLSAYAAAKLGAAADNPRVDQMLAENSINQHKFKEAIDEYETALALDPKLPGVHYPLCLLLLHQGKTDDGERELAAALVADPHNDQIRLLLERSRAGSLPQSMLEDLLAAPPPGVRRLAAGFVDPVPLQPSHGRLGSLENAEHLYARGEYKVATADLKELVFRNPRNVDALYWLVKCYQALSLRALDQIGQVAPDSPRAHQLLAEGLEQQEHYPLAIEEYRRVLARDPRIFGIHYAMGLDLLHTSNWDEARKEFERELEIDSFNAGANYRLGQLAYRATKYDEARRYFSRAIEIFPAFGEARVQLGQVLIKEGQYQDAISHLLAATRLLPDEHAVHFQLFHAYRALGQKDLAQKELEIFQRMELEKKEATQRKAAESMEQMRRTGTQRLEPAPLTEDSSRTPQP